MAQSHMPPWMTFEGKVPKLCHEFRLRIELGGEGHKERKPRVLAPTALCAAFGNMIVFCKATFVTSDETAAKTASDATSLGFIFLKNLSLDSMTTQSTSGPRSLSFSLNVSSGDKVTFILPSDAVATFDSWQTTLKASLKGEFAKESESVVQVLHMQEQSDTDSILYERDSVLCSKYTTQSFNY